MLSSADLSGTSPAAPGTLASQSSTHLLHTHGPDGDGVVWIDPEGHGVPLSLEDDGTILLDDTPIAHRDADTGEITMLDPGPARPAFTLVINGPDGELARIEGAEILEREDEAP